MHRIMKLMAVRHEFYKNNPGVGASELHLLEHIAICETKGVPLCVTDAMKLKSVASPATIHRYFNTLIEYDLIHTVHDAFDIRIKYIHLTARGRAYFRKLERLLAKML